MSEREAVLIVFWALLIMTVVGALLPTLLPGLVRFVNRVILKEDGAGGH
jgi:hypothetical protein